MPVDEIKAGMVGIGRTVFEGTDLQDFKAHILGRAAQCAGADSATRSSRGSRAGRLAKTGVAAGMSGSPVYIDGRLIGAVSYSIGAFPTEAIAGITPIAEMKDATEILAACPTPQARIELPITREGSDRSAERHLRADGAFRESPGRRPGDRHGYGSRLAARRDAAPDLDAARDEWFRAGIGRDADRPPSAPRDSRRWSAAAMAQGAPELKTMTGPLARGDAVGVSLVGGDLEMGATGTITHIDGDRVYAFGHPFFNVGPSQFPMTRAYVYAMLPSLMSSFKISSMGEVIGTMQQDRATAIAGTLGKGPAVIPMAVTLQSQRDDGSSRSAPSRSTSPTIRSSRRSSPMSRWPTPWLLRATVRRRDVHHQEPRADQGTRRPDSRRCVHRRQRGAWGRDRDRRADHDAAEQRS